MIFFFFSSRRRHTRYWRDWSSDVCSSDLIGGQQAVDAAKTPQPAARPELMTALGATATVKGALSWANLAKQDRKSVVEGKSVDLGGRRIIKKKKRIYNT